MRLLRLHIAVVCGIGMVTSLTYAGDEKSVRQKAQQFIDQYTTKFVSPKGTRGPTGIGDHYTADPERPRWLPTLCGCGCTCVSFAY